MRNRTHQTALLNITAIVCLWIGDSVTGQTITVDCGAHLGRLEPFWSCTGFGPSTLLCTPDMKQNLEYIGSIPHGGCRYIREHDLLDLVDMKNPDADHPDYEWSQLDYQLDLLVANGLRPFFCLMGRAGGYFDDFNNPVKLRAWRRLIRDLVLHCQDRYGVDEVRSWYFETWNEPNCNFKFEWDTQEFLKYYDACSEGLREADATLRFGGAGSGAIDAEIQKALIAHCDAGTDHITGQTGVRLDFISYHKKADPVTMTDAEVKFIDWLRKEHPRVANVPLMNNEADRLVGWNKPKDFRPTSRYATFVCKSINQHIVRIIDGLGVTYPILTNDNAFLGPWGYRTHMTRFGDRERFELIKKPVHTVMTMLALLGDRRCVVSGAGSVNGPFGAIATLSGAHQVAVLLYNDDDTSNVREVTLTLKNLPFDSVARLVHYRLDSKHTNPYEVWKRMGSPEHPTGSQYCHLRTAQELALLDEPNDLAVRGNTATIRFELPAPGVSLLLLNAEPETPLGKVTGVRLATYEGLTGNDQTMVLWRGLDSRFIRTYSVLYSEYPGGPYRRVNEPDLLCTAFLHTKQRGAGRGYYKIQAIDYWDRPGYASDLLSAP